MKKTVMTADAARSFTSFSVANKITVESSLPCGCVAYVDVYTYNRWRALGFQVQKGEKAIRIPVVKTSTRETASGQTETRKFLGSGAVFCRHQVKAIAGSVAGSVRADVSDRQAVERQAVDVDRLYEDQCADITREY